MNSVDELKQRLVEVWKSAAERYWRGHQRVEKASMCVRADGQHFEHLLWAHTCDWQKLWTNKI